MNLHGLHHVTAVSGKIGLNADFYTRVLGLRLVKKSVNQDDVSAYHLFYADKVGSPGTDMTFFDWPQAGPDVRGTDSIVATAFRVNGRDALEYWLERLGQYGVTVGEIETFAGRQILRFEDPEGQRLLLVDDQGAEYEGEIWDGTDVPVEHALRGFYATMLSVPLLKNVEPILTRVLNFVEADRADYPDGQEVIVYEMDGGGPGRELWLREEPNQPRARLGAGGTHHVAFRVSDREEQEAWHSRLQEVRMPVSGLIDRFYFRSIYFRISNGILFEIATDGPGFDADEEMDSLGETLALPPFLEPRREEIEANLKPIEAPVA
ncbi:MAG: ring-cleaving dioxygenase [Candidatus Promineifilaceae bacterium]|nr:ring-cleaving dioxygenase [Candidatus Promineifilaceae bacterium]